MKPHQKSCIDCTMLNEFRYQESFLFWNQYEAGLIFVFIISDSRQYYGDMFTVHYATDNVLNPIASILPMSKMP